MATGFQFLDLERLLEEAAKDVTPREKDKCSGHKHQPELLRLLEKEGIQLLSKRKPKFPWATWFCQTCDFHLENLSKVREHLKVARHLQLEKARTLTTTLRLLPRPSPLLLRGIEVMLEKVNKEQGLDEDDLAARNNVARKVEKLLATQLFNCTVTIYGSSFSGFGLRSSSLDLKLGLPPDCSPSKGMATAAKTLRDEFSEVFEDFHGQAPAITFSADGLCCKLSYVLQSSVDTSLLLKDYLHLDSRVQLLGVALRCWGRQVKVETGEEGGGGLPSHALSLLLVNFLQKQAVLPIIHTWLEPGVKLYNSPHEMLRSWKTGNEVSAAELWVELFRWLALGLRGEGVISICGDEEKTDFKGKRLTIEDPFASKKNLCSSMSQAALDHLADCFKASYLYFGSLQTSLGPIIEVLVPTNEPKEVEEDDYAEFDATTVPVVEVSKPVDDSLEAWLALRGTSLTLAEAAMAEQLVSSDQVAFSMDGAKLSLGHPPGPQCTVCFSSAHPTSICPEDQRLQLVPLPRLEAHYKNMMEAMLGDIVLAYHPEQEELMAREMFVKELTAFITQLWPDARLKLFGSSCNGFSFRDSDLDISVTFEGVDTSEQLDCSSLVEELSSHLLKMRGVTKVLPITAAKVPIVKLFHGKFNIEADISLYNVLASENSAMLALYADIDERFKVLGYLVKLFAKCCDLCDASKGSLSSYAYLLMMLHYLQQVKPPVLPVLQQIYPEGESKPEHLVEGWNAWYFTFEDSEELKRSWPQLGFNTCSVLQLWTGFLGFYAATFDDKMYVVSVRQREMLTKFEKLWNSSRLAIEDPFDLSHNLSSGLSQKMWLHIKKAFAKGREVFGQPLLQLPPNVRWLQEYLFSGVQYVTGPPPRDRNCFECGRIGHIAVNCPRKVKQKERKKKQSNPEEKRKGSLPPVVEQISDVSTKDVNDNFDYNSLKHMELDQGAIDYLKPRDVTLDEPEFVILKDVLPVADAQEPGSKGLADHLGQGEMMEDVQEMKRLNSRMMSQCNTITRRCKEERRRK